MNLVLIAEFIRMLGASASIFTDNADVARVANTGADLLASGAEGYAKFEALAEEMKQRQAAGVHATTAEIDDVLARIQARSADIQNAS